MSGPAFISLLPASNGMSGTEVLPVDQNQSGALMTVKVTPLQVTDLKQLYTDTGSANTIVITPAIAYTAYAAGQFFGIKVAAANTGATTLNVNGLGAKPVVTADGAALLAGTLAVGGSYLFIYNGTSFVVIGNGPISNVYWVDTGAANAYVITPVPAIAAYTAGLRFYMKAANSSTGASTINVNGLGAKTLISPAGAAIGRGQILSGGIYEMIYDGTNFQVLDRSTATTNQNYWAASGTNTITATPVPAYSAYTDGMTVTLKMANTTTAAATLNINGLGAANLFYSDGVTALTGGSLVSNNIYTFVYDSSMPGFICINPSRVAGSFTLTLTGMTATVTGTVNYVIGNDGKSVIFIMRNDISGTSNATTMTGTGIPTALQPATTFLYAALAIRDSNSGAIGGQVSITAASGTWVFGNALPTTQGAFPKAWTNTSLKGLFGQSFTYTLD